MTLVRKALLATALVLVILVGTAYWLVGTAGGTHWLLGRATGYLPQELQIGETGGSLLRGVSIESIAWDDATTGLQARSFYVEARLWPLLGRQLIIDKLDVGRVEISMAEDGEPAGDTSLPDVDLPIDILINSSTVRQIWIAKGASNRSIDEISLAGRLSGSDLLISELSVLSDWLGLDLSGQLILADDYPGSIEANWTWKDPQRGTFTGQARIEGDMREYALDLEADASIDDRPEASIKLAGTVAGTVGDNGPDIDLRVERLEGEINQNLVRGSGMIGISGPDYSVSNTRLQVGSNSIRIDGGFGRSLSLRAEIDAADIAEVLPDANGSLRGRVFVRGANDNPDVQANLSGVALTWRDYSLESLSASADISALNHGTAEVRLGQLSVGDIEVDEAQISVTGRLAAHDLRASLRALDTNLVVAASGGYERQAWSGQIASLTIDNEVLDRWSTLEPSQLAASSDRVSLSRTCLAGPQHTSKFCLGGNVLADGPASFELSVSKLPVSAIPVLPPEGVSLQGHLFADVSGEWASDRLSAKSNVEWRDAAINTVYDEELVSLIVTKAVGEMTVVDNRVTSTVQVELADRVASGDIELTIEDFADSQSAISGRANVSMSDTSMAAVAVPGFLNPQGQVDGTLALSGSMDSPEFLGEIALADGSFGVRQTGIEVSEVNLRLAQLVPGQLRLHGSARSGDGQIAIEGRTQISAGTGVRSELQVSGENFELARLPDWQIAASPSIAVVFDDRTASVSGELTLPTANIRVREIPESAESSSPDAVVHRTDSAPPPPARRIDVDVRAVLGDDVQFAGFGLVTGLQGAVEVRGGSQTAYTGNGRLALREGRYKAYGQELEIERGELIFNGPLDNPQLDVRAIRRISDVIAGIQLSGTPAELQSSVFSEPAMGDAEVLSYLLTGRPLASATDSGDGNVLNNAAFALGLSGAGSITSQIRGQLGLETLTIAGGADDSRLIAGKRFGDRLLVEYGYGLIDRLGTLMLRYQLNDRFVLESRTGTISSLDLLYSVKKK